ncbi:tRNA 5-methoxyuridine(34)/uridine 5-oxyacetic acid(34) synthase CmoB [Saccharophagus sp. K07]|jgi:tRNA (mo5U34)-methyltransferase|uniref:tRNA 5-methoxyuridine(34)/uridine 5-oxyacetic acid(34) synthase CmoB n=1 Tax=Saccharophagus sp. K07 TaxID=2283636 RepID=UPI001651FB43|nr:tRNA 5-methoxyuridine(34)/uridine 5-oxyacetic acid(34) synthase CmoB [Saccharophagus sp. K07]MBC6904786.1 tRNA 5-methoxyuridine(34)/uridine 5-oxyacetic acid(34) synthase CmoB [Saccharophagus sp. K07]
MIDYSRLLEQLAETPLAPLAANLPSAIEKGLSIQRYGDLPDWYQAMDQLPDLQPDWVELRERVAIGLDNIDPNQRSQLEQALRALIPWRKGPFEVFGIHIDTEWRSDWKWDRVVPHLSSLEGRRVLDVGCGNGYHCLRMFGAGAARVIGIDPSPRFVVQFYMLKKYLGDIPVDVLPVGIESLPPNLEAFDTTFSMGVFYHRRSPMDHLRELKDTLRPGGELVLETLVIEGGEGQVLVPEGRYAMMNNVWFIPSSITLTSWLRKSGFVDVRVVNECVTTTEEQRSTDWMRFHSLPEFLDPNNPALTAEGHPAPRRAVLIARKPA